MRLRSVIAFGLAVACLSQPIPASASVEFVEDLRAGDRALRLHATGVLRYKIFFEGYAAALYLSEDFAGDATPENVLADVPRRIEIEYFWPIGAEIFADVTREGIAEVAGTAASRALENEVRELNALYRDVAPGDRYALTYLPGVGTELALNGEPLGLVEGAEFSSVLFSLWLGERALDASLRDQLLGESRS